MSFLGSYISLRTFYGQRWFEYYVGTPYMEYCVIEPYCGRSDPMIGIGKERGLGV